MLSKQTDYYNLAGHLIGSFNGTTTTYYMTDGLDSVITAYSQTAIQGEQVYGPFGASSYQSGTINTAKGYTGQVHDGVTGLDYYVARYYDPVMGMFLSVDTVQGNQQGMNPYTYVVDNPETATDPTGHAGTATCLDACPETTTKTTAVLNDEQQVVNLFENPALTPVEVAASISLIAVSVAALSAIALIAFSVFLEWYVLTYHPKASTFYDGSKSSPAPTPAPTPGTGTTVSATPTATPATSTSGAGAFCGGSSACRDFVNRSMGWLTSSPNKLNHVFENNIHDHKWNLTGLSMAGNLDLIAQVIEAYYSRILVDPRGTLYTLRFGTYEVTVKGYYDPKTGIYQVNTAYVNP